MKGYALSPASLVAGTLEATRRAGCRATAASRRSRGGRVLTRSALAEDPLLGDHLDAHADLRIVTAGQRPVSLCRPRRSYQKRAAHLRRMLRQRTRSRWSWHVQSAWTPDSALAGRGTGVHLLLHFSCCERRATPELRATRIADHKLLKFRCGAGSSRHCTAGAASARSAPVRACRSMWTLTPLSGFEGKVYKQTNWGGTTLFECGCCCAGMAACSTATLCVWSDVCLAVQDPHHELYIRARVSAEFPVVSPHSSLM